MDWTKAPCNQCGKPVDLQHDHYRKVTDMQKVTRYWHNVPNDKAKRCWDAQFDGRKGVSCQIVN